ncbi:MAG: hypothetical protein IMZ61_12320 [Planctomycetes bacterium]|nr:hypothetical protein [Planctomycetota bacterium]
MNNLQSNSIEEKVRLVTLMPEPSSEFVNELWNQLSEKRSHKPSLTDRFRLAFRPTWAVVAAILLALAILFIGLGPQRVYAAVVNFLGLGDPGLQSVQDAGLVTDLNVTAKPTVLPTNTPVSTLNRPHRSSKARYWKASL